jgi:hypothetical protein
MRSNRTGCLIGLLIVTLLVVVLALGAAWILLDWSARGGDVSIRLPFAPGIETSTPAPSLPTSTPPLATPIPPAATPTSAIGQLTSTPPVAVEGTPAPIVLQDPSLSDLASELTSVESGQAIWISMSEDALQQELSTYLSPYSESGYQFQSVAMESGRLVIQGKGQMDALVVNFTITVRPSVADCWFVVDVESVKLGKFPAPAFMTDEVQTYVDQWTEAYGNTGVVCVTEISVTNENMLLTGYVR